jgi:hypothetical protein
MSAVRSSLCISDDGERSEGIPSSVCSPAIPRYAKNLEKPWQKGQPGLNSHRGEQRVPLKKVRTEVD